MPYYVNLDDRTLAGPQDVAPSFGLSLTAGVGDVLTGNVSTLMADSAKLQNANRGVKLPKLDAEQRVKDAGVKLTIPDDGYTNDALEILIKRKQTENLRRRISDATPWSWIGSPVRGGAMLLTGLLDPLNVASAFVPVVGEARTASLIANATNRFGARAAIGAAEGAAGAAALEVPTYLLRRQLGDEYTMADSLLNMTFGTVLGGGLHAVGGAIGDALSGNAYARFAGLDTPQIGKVLDFERGKLTDITDFTPGMRRAAGLPEQIEVRNVEAANRRDPGAAAQPALLPEAPFAKLTERTQDSARAVALANLKDDIKAELLADMAGRADKRVIASAREELTALDQRAQALGSEDEFKRRAKEYQGQGLSRKQAESQARKDLSAELADAKQSTERLQNTIEQNAKASQAEQDLARIDKGEVPTRFEAKVSEEAKSLMGASEIARAINGTEPPASFVIGMASPDTREAAFRAALSHMASGRLPDVESLVRLDPSTVGARSTVDDVRMAGQRAASADAAYLGNPQASAAADARIKEAPKTQGLTEAEAELKAAQDELKALADNLEKAGIDKERLAKMIDMESFDAEVKRADAIGRAVKAGALCGVRQ